MKTKMKHILIVPVIFILTAGVSFAQEIENEFQTRANLDLSFKPLKKLKLSFEPELRLDEDFSPDKYLLEGEVEYKAFKNISFAASYGFVGNIRNNKDTEYLNRYAFSAEYEKDFNRFEASFRLKYSNYADDDISDKNFLRYKLGLEYDIPDCKITPSLAVQPFQDLVDGGLYKTRYDFGIDYKLFKNNYLEVGYKFDYYNTEYLNKHIVSLGYKVKF
jgi:hypothetical protein